MKNILPYLQPFLKMLAFLGCYYFIMSVLAAMLIPLLGRVDLARMSAAEMTALQSSPSILLLMQLSSVISLLISLFFFMKLPPAKDYAGIGLTGEAVLKDILRGGLLGTAIILIVFLILWLCGAIASFQLNEAVNPVMLLIWFCIYLIVAFVEELMFRGYLLTIFMERFSPLLAISITSLAFGALHLLNPSASWLGFVNISLAGMLMALAFFKRGNIWLPMGIHMGWNFIQGTVLGFHVSGLEGETLFQLQSKGPAWLSGGEFGLEGSMITFLVCIAAILLLYYRGQLTLKPITYDDESD